MLVSLTDRALKMSPALGCSLRDVEHNCISKGRIVPKVGFPKHFNHKREKDKTYVVFRYKRIKVDGSWMAVIILAIPVPAQFS